VSDEVNITQALLNEAVSAFITTKLKYLALGTGDADITLTTSDVEGAVAITTSRNLLADTVTVDENFFRILFILTSTMPNSQPVDYHQIGIHDGSTDTSELYWGHTTAVPITKDNDSQHEIIISGRVIELEQLPLT
jgi:hypothetical protein